MQKLITSPRFFHLLCMCHLALIGCGGSDVAEADRVCTLQMKLSGAVEKSIDLKVSDSPVILGGCSGTMDRNSQGNMNFSSSMLVSPSTPILTVNLDFEDPSIKKGETAENLKGSVEILQDNPEGQSDQTWVATCVINMTINQSYHDENRNEDRYIIGGSGSCSNPAVENVDSSSTVTISDFTFQVADVSWSD